MERDRVITPEPHVTGHAVQGPHSLTWTATTQPQTHCSGRTAAGCHSAPNRQRRQRQHAEIARHDLQPKTSENKKTNDRLPSNPWGTLAALDPDTVEIRTGEQGKLYRRTAAEPGWSWFEIACRWYRRPRSRGTKRSIRMPAVTRHEHGPE